MSEVISVRFVIYWEDGKWTARGLEHDLVAHGGSMEELDILTSALIETVIERCGGLDHISPAPAFYWDLCEEDRRGKTRH